MSDPLAYFLTWTTYGTRLHGDERGSVDRRNNTYGTPALQPNSPRVRWEHSQLKGTPVFLDPVARLLVANAIEEHCRHKRWDVYGLAVRSNHVHIVVSYASLKPEPVMNQLKAWATKALRAAGKQAADARTWTKHGSTGYLWNATQINNAVAYTMEAQDLDR